MNKKSWTSNFRKQLLGHETLRRETATGDRGASQFVLSSNLPKGERGAVIALPVDVERTNNGISINEFKPISDSLIRTALLFVEKIDVPDNNMVSGGDLPTIEHLREMGLAARSRVEFDKGPTYEQVTRYPWFAFKELNKRDSGRWSIWQEEGQSVIPESELTPDMAFQIEFNSALIVPHHAVPFDDIMVFRESHKDELMSLRHHMEEMIIRLSNEGDVRAINIEIEKFDASLAEYLTKARQSNLRKVVASLTAEMDWSAAVRGVWGGGGGGLLSVAGNLSLGAGALAIGGGILSALTIKSAAGLRKGGPSPFRYIARVQREFI